VSVGSAPSCRITEGLADTCFVDGSRTGEEMCSEVAVCHLGT